tara:strand:+ start:60 stop:533 length:474 start_codon:yes stop_codon:yes gene_type:complete
MTIEWEPLELGSQNTELKDEINANLDSLSISPEELHLAFFDQAHHLTETIVNQNLITEITGENPEKTDSNQKIISMTSMANEFNGMITEDTLSIPFKGISHSQVNVEYAHIETNWAIKLSIDSTDISNQSIIRTFLLPQTASKPSVNWSSDKLNIIF